MATRTPTPSLPTPTPLANPCQDEEVQTDNLIGDNPSCIPIDPEPGPGGMPLWLYPPSELCEDNRISGTVAIEGCEELGNHGWYQEIECDVRPPGMPLVIYVASNWSSGTVKWSCCESCN
jgi:hypothetical protein